MSNSILHPGTTYPSVVGSILEKLRQQHRINQKDFAAQIGITQATWSRIESGNSALTIEQLATAASQLNKQAGDILMMADEAVISIKAQGIKVERERVKDPLDSGLALIGAAALGGLIAAILLRK